MSRTDLVARFAAVPDRLAAQLGRPGSIRDHPTSDGWTTREEVLHLLVVESVVWQRRLDDLAAGGHPRWSRTEPKLGAIPDTRATGELAAAFGAARAETIVRLSRLDENEWLRSGMHERFGRLDVEGLVRIALDHDEEHLAALG